MQFTHKVKKPIELSCIQTFINIGHKYLYWILWGLQYSFALSLDLDSDYGQKTLGFDVRLKQTIPPENYILANNSFIKIQII
jgi:hypothetical protein